MPVEASDEKLDEGLGIRGERMVRELSDGELKKVLKELDEGEEAVKKEVEKRVTARDAGEEGRGSDLDRKG